MTSSSSRRRVAGVLCSLALVGSAGWLLRPSEAPAWNEAEVEIIRSLRIDSLASLPDDASNAVADDARAARLGHRLFFDPRLSATGQVACVTCHQPERRFTDGLTTGRAIGRSRRNTPSIVGTAYSPWLYWDGRKDSQWSQALSPLEDPNEHGSNRMELARFIADDPEYRRAYASLFGSTPDFSDRSRFPDAASPLPGTGLVDAWDTMSAEDRDLVNATFANIGKAIAAYERLLLPGPSLFDRYAEAVTEGDEAAARAAFNADEAVGLQLFIGKAQCIECHNGPLLTNNEFHNTGIISSPGEIPDRGRIDGVREARADPFNCMGRYSDDAVKDCAELRFARTGTELIAAIRTPSLRNLAGTAPYAHKGQISTLAELLNHYSRAPLAMTGHNEAKPLDLSRRERRQIEAFLTTLAAPIGTPREWLSVPSADALRTGFGLDRTDFVGAQ